MEASTTLQQSLESTCKELNAKNAILEEEKREKASLQKDLNEAVDTIQARVYKVTYLAPTGGGGGVCFQDL